MSERDNRFRDGRVVGAAVKTVGEILRPFIADAELLTLIDSIKTKEDMAGWYPVQALMALFEIAQEKNIISRVAENRAVGTLQFLMTLPDIKSAQDVLTYVVNGISNHHKGYVGKMVLKLDKPFTAEISDTTYLPCGYTIPMLCKTMAGYGAKKVESVHRPENCRQNGARECRYTITWEESTLQK